MLTDAPRIVTARLGHEDSHTLERYLATGGYEGLRKALSMTPEAVHDEINTASLLGRGGAGFPAGRKWSMLRQAPTTYLVINGDESEPATFKDHLLIERDPHQIVEGTIIAAYSIGAAAGLHLLPRGIRPRPRAAAAGGERGVRPWRTRRVHIRVGLLDRPRRPPWGRRLHLWRGDGAPRSARGKAWFPPDQAPVLPRRGRALRRADSRQQRRDDVEPALDRAERGAAFAALGAGTSTGTRLFALSGHVERPGWYELEMSKTTFRDLIYEPSLGGGVRNPRQLKAFIPGGVSAPWFFPEHLDMGLDQDAVGQAGSMLGSGSVVVMDETTCVVRAAWRITRFFHKESCGQCTPCREGSGWVENILRRIEDGFGREEDLDLLLDLCDNIAPGLTWPPKQTTICVLGPSIPSSIVSGIHHFRDEFLLHVKEGGCPMPPDEVRHV